MTLQANLERIRELAEAQTVECRSGLEHDYGTCAAGCKGGYVPDPAFAGLLEVVRRPCQRCRGSGRTLWSTNTCPSCHGTGYTARNWSGQPKGALAGAFKHWVESQYHVEANLNADMSLYNELSRELTSCFGEPDCNEKAAQVVREAMESLDAAHPA